MSQSTTPTGPAKSKRAVRGTKGEKPARPDDCPLTPHPNGQWCKKVKGKVHFFGPWHGLPGALLRWDEAKEDLLKGRPYRPAVEGAFDIDSCTNLFLGWKESLIATGELSHAMGRGGVPQSVGPQPLWTHAELMMDHDPHLEGPRRSPRLDSARLSYFVIQCRDDPILQHMRHRKKTIEISWRLKDHRKSEVPYRVVEAFRPSAEELTELPPKLKRVAEETQRRAPLALP